MSKKSKWVVVLDDSNCTVGVGGEGYLHEVIDSDNSRYSQKESSWYNYNKSIFRDATESEIDNWVKYKKRANVPKHGKPYLYQDIFGKLGQMFDGLLKKK